MRKVEKRLFTQLDLLKKKLEYNTKIKNTEITEDTFKEIEDELTELLMKQNEVKEQIKTLVDEANSMCRLYSTIQQDVNELYSDLKCKKLKDEGIDLSKQANVYKYNSYLSHRFSYGDGYRVELKSTLH